MFSSPPPKAPHIVFSAPRSILTKLIDFRLSNLLSKDYMKNLEQLTFKYLKEFPASHLQDFSITLSSTLNHVTHHYPDNSLPFPYNQSRLGQPRGSLWKDCRHPSDLRKHITITPRFQANVTVPCQRHGTLL